MNQRIRDVLSEMTTRYIFPFLWLKGETEETLKEYMRVIHDAGCNAVCLESRPHPDFCGPKWWRDLDVIIEEAKKLDMKLWILDDSHFPTGYANGSLKPDIERGDYTLTRQSVTYRVLGDGSSFSMPEEKAKDPGEAVPTRTDAYLMKESPKFDDDRLLGVYAVRADGEKGIQELCAQDGKYSFNASIGTWRVYGIYLTRNRGPHRDYINMMYQPSCRRIIDAVYKPHFEHYAAEFGKTILGFFSDEPELGNGHLYQMDKRLHEVEDLPWSPELEQAWGSVRFSLLPLLWETEYDPDETAGVRLEYMNLVTRLVRRDFSEQIGDWCRSHGVKYIGHLIEDHNQHIRCGSSLGHYFRGLAGQDMAGIDDIGGQVLPQGEDLDAVSKWQPHRDGTFYHFALGNLAASAAAIEPAKHGDSMCEIFGNYDWAEGVNLEKYLAEHFLVRGINHYVPHAFSAAPFPDKDCPPHFYAHGNNPQYRHFGCLIRYMERVCHLISGGKPYAPVAVLYHAEADWTGGKNQFGEVCGRILTEHQISWHFVPSDVFDETERYNTVIRSGCLDVNGQEYRVIVVPEATYVSDTACRGLESLQENGVKVGLIGTRPKAVGLNREVRSGSVIPLSDLPEFCSGCESAHVETASSMLRCLRYKGGDYELTYLLNESAEPWEGMVKFSVAPGYSVYRYDAWDNCCYKFDRDKKMCLEPSKGCLLIADENDTLLCEAYEAPANALELTEFERSVCKATDYPTFKNPKKVTLPDLLEQELPDFGGFVRYQTRIDCLELPLKPVWLEIEGAQEGIEVFVNGDSLGIQIVPVYRFELADKLKLGINDIVIEQATTLERVVPRRDGKPAENHVGINSRIVIRYSDGTFAKE